ncbi:uncharacterized protein LOC135084399 [Ostrinia nubilalis]|uniref:uncharacterized protein LOC135084399 n=1 Tax=Ostrinia nubilalis TaxID=29057 RepID=UPI0030822593
MIERVHRQLKASLMCHDNTWTTSLPFVLLGMRTAFKEDIKATAAEMVYGENLRLPGEMLAPSVSIHSPENASDFVEKLRHKMADIRPIPASRHSKPSAFIFKDLSTATHVFLRDDTVRRPLQPPYTGPHPIIERSHDGKSLTINIKGKKSNVSIDRVKPAYTDSTTENLYDSQPKAIETLPPAPPQPEPTADSSEKRSYTTRAGRHVKFKDLNEYIFFT